MNCWRRSTRWPIGCGTGQKRPRRGLRPRTAGRWSDGSSARVAALRVRLDAPLVVATLGGTGTGKSALVNALAGAEVVAHRPTTADDRSAHVGLPRPDIRPSARNRPAGGGLGRKGSARAGPVVLLDLSDPDTRSRRATGQPDEISPGCGGSCRFATSILVTTTQQKYRNARVAEELAAAVPGRSLVFVADPCRRGRGHPRRLSGTAFGTFFRARAGPYFPDRFGGRDGPAHQGRSRPTLSLPRRSISYARQFPVRPPRRIRRANFLDLADRTLDSALQPADHADGAGGRGPSGDRQQRQELSAGLHGKSHAELLASSRPWESRLLGQVTSAGASVRYFSSCCEAIRARGRCSRSVALSGPDAGAAGPLGAVSSARAWHSHRQDANLRQRPGRAGRGGRMGPDRLRASAMILEGYASRGRSCRGKPRVPETVAEAEADGAGLDFAADWARSGCPDRRQADRHTGWFTRGVRAFAAGHAGAMLYLAGRETSFTIRGGPLAPAAVWGLSLVSSGRVLACFVVFSVALAFTWRHPAAPASGDRPACGRLDEPGGGLGHFRPTGGRMPPGRAVSAGPRPADERRRAAAAGDRQWVDGETPWPAISNGRVSGNGRPAWWRIHGPGP